VGLCTDRSHRDSIS